MPAVGGDDSLNTALLSRDVVSGSATSGPFSSYFGSEEEQYHYQPVVVPPPPSEHGAGAAVVAVNVAEAAVVHHPRPTLNILTGLRGVLAIWILCHNMVGVWEPSTPPELLAGWPLLSGSVAVSMFFALSGFVLTYSYGDHAFTNWPCYWSFLGRRYGRMMPMYLLAVLFCLGGEVHNIQQYGWDGWTVVHWIATLTGTNTWVYWPEYSRSGAPPFLRGYAFFNGSIWSIETELFFYCCFPLLCRLLRWSLGGLATVEEVGVRDEKLNSRLTRLLGWFVLLTCTSLLNSVAVWYSRELMAVLCYGVPIFRISEFMLGMVTCCIFLLLVQARKEPHDGRDGSVRQFVDKLCSWGPLYSRWSLDVLCLFVGALLVCSGLLVRDAGLSPQFLQQNPGTFVSLLALILLLAVLTCSPYAPSSKRGVVSFILTQPITQQMGVLSFAFYTFHLVPIYYLRSINQTPIESIAVEFCAAMGLACMAHVYVEKPAYQWVAKRLPRCHCAVPPPTVTTQPSHAALTYSK